MTDGTDGIQRRMRSSVPIRVIRGSSSASSVEFRRGLSLPLFKLRHEGAGLAYFKAASQAANLMEKPIVFLSHSSKNKRELIALKELLDRKAVGFIKFFLSSDGESIP